ncbi:MAG: FAD-dependent oxidoreductase [Phycisphaerae bacterium]|nr:FAD-dependent oxidoreductase [Phycisphaerae bacterium]
MKTERRFLAESGTEIFTGNELLVKGALESEGGVHLLGGYPGSPIAGYFDSLTALKELLAEKGIRAVINNNEALSAAMLNGSQTLPVRVMITMKSVGLHVAADALALANLAGAHKQGGAIVVYGDDPWSDSTQVPSDSRFLSKHLYIPVIEPSNAQEVKDFVDISFKISSRSELIAGFVLTTNLADGGGTVQCSPNHYPEVGVLNKFDLVTKNIDVDKRVLLPPRTWWREASFPKRHAIAMQVARECGMNRIDHPAKNGKRPLGFISAGLGHDYLVQGLFELGVLGEFPILKFGMSYPADPQLIEELAQQCEKIVVIEERRGFLEEQVAQIVMRQRQADPNGAFANTEVYGKQFPGDLKGIPANLGLDPSIIMLHVGPLIQKFGVDSSVSTRASDSISQELQMLQSTQNVDLGDVNIPLRLPVFCPGCPHRDSASLCLDIKRRFMDPRYMKKAHNSEPVDLMFHGDTGCYTLLMFPPTNDLMHDYSGMGLGGGTGSGTDPFTTNKEVVFMGDSTFFHSGAIAISQAIKLKQDITFIILNNSTTGMTGHQPTPGVEYDLLGNVTPRQDIQDVLRGMASRTDINIVSTNPEDRKAYTELLEHMFLADGVKVVISDKECGITRIRRRRRDERALVKEKNFLPKKQYMNVNQDICCFCLSCTEITGCPGLQHVQTDYGPKVDTAMSWCVVDGACERVGACDSFEKLTVYRKRPPKSLVPELGLDKIPEPRKRPTSDTWWCCLTGVGGMGIGLATSILVRAGHYEGYDVTFFDKKGMAIRNGGVTSQVVFNIAKQPVTGIMPYGKADLLLGVDVLEAARVLDPKGRTRAASSQQTAAVINTAKVATSTVLMGWDDFDTDQLVEFIRHHTRKEYFLARDISRICEKYLGSKIYANIMMMGYAFQQGLIPISMHSMAWSIKDAIRVDFKKNLYAFNMGRKLVEQQDLFLGAPEPNGWKETLDSKIRWATRRYGKGSKLPEQLREMVTTSIENMPNLDEQLKRDVVVRSYDCMRWGRIPYAKRYLDQVTEIYAKDTSKHDYAATKAVIHNLASAMLIKDSVFEAELGTAPEKFAHDRKKYNVNPANGDRISYRYLWKRKLSFAGREVLLRLSLQKHQLELLKRMAWIRPLLKRWNRRELSYRARYEKHIAEFAYASPEQYAQGVARLGSPMCMSCKSPSCSDRGCPLKSDIPRWMELAESGKWKQAATVLHESNNFPEFTALICPAFCQDTCHNALHDFPSGIMQTEKQIIDIAFENGWITPQAPKTSTGQKIAIVGAGPSGLAAAQQLARKGHAVTVFEKDDEPGGLLRYAIPAERLDKTLIDRRLEQLRGEGIEFKCGSQVGVDINAAELAAEFDATCLTTGRQLSRQLNVPGCDLGGIVTASDYLRSQILAGDGIPSINASGKTVAIIGGGLTGEDCVEAALKQGAREIHQLEILPQYKVANSATPEGVEKHWSVKTTVLSGDGGQVRSLRAVRVSYNSNGAKQVCEEIDGSEFDIPADIVVLAMGFEPKVDKKVAEQLGLVLTENGSLEVDENDATSRPGVFAAGDLIASQAYVATAIDSGRRTASIINKYLAGKNK